MRLETTEIEGGIKIKIVGDENAAVVIKDREKERILLPLETKNPDNTYYYENSSGLIETEEGYIGFYPREPEEIKLIN